MNELLISKISEKIKKAPSDPIGDDITYRQLLSWAAEITGTCGYIDWQGKLRLEWYESTTATINNTVRFSSDLAENAIEITGVQIVTEDTEHLVGNDGYAMLIEDNALIQHDIESLAEVLYQHLAGFSYVPFTATTKPMPHIYPLDMASFVDKQGLSHNVIITDVTFILNANTSLQGKGETVTNNGYASANPLTRRESAIIKNLTKLQNESMNDSVQSILALNELISNALGLYQTPVRQADGSIIYYLHNKAELTESDTIFTMTASGIAWTTSGWNNGSPIWSYGVTSAGDALFNMVSAKGIEVSQVGEDYSIEISPSAFRIYYKNMLVTNIEADQMTIPKAQITDYLECGKIRFVPYQSIGTNIVFLD